ncbi:MAG: Unknown protein [uncultured Sulfurovum sp.]|uniref:NrfJ n=1 Tax=uncultured Sulfurovum sp. TaxID=269237 RepID=A0A6S6SLA2_9BACT|nr:MAG: Unknown protein [uncultured Sulfurovum sp.]
MNKTYLLIALTCMTLQAQDLNQTTETNQTAVVNPYYQGDVVTVEHGGAYSYLEVQEHTGETFWVAVNAAEVKVGDYVRFQKELVSKNFKSKALDRTFDELIFGSHLQYKVLK